MMKRLLVFVFSSLFIGIGINTFILPLHLINGGVFGISLLLNYLFGFKLAYLIILINTPIYIIALFYDKSFFVNGLLGVIITSVVIELLVPLNGLIHLPIVLSAILGGIFVGMGIGLMLRNKISPGGIDLLALLISKWFTINPGLVIFLIDSSIVSIGIAVLHDFRLIYSILLIFSAGILISAINSFKSIDVYIK